MVQWYEQRLYKLDQATKLLGPSFQERITLLRRLRAEAGEKRAAQQEARRAARNVSNGRINEVESTKRVSPLSWY